MPETQQEPSVEYVWADVDRWMNIRPFTRQESVVASGQRPSEMSICLSCGSSSGQNGLCQTCRTPRVFCVDCGSRNDLYEFRDALRCYDCINPIMNYSTDVLSIKRWRPSSNSSLYYGIELELSNRTGNFRKNAVESLKLVDDFAILKSDSSVRNGFEIVTIPTKYSKIAKLWQPFFDNIPKGLVGYVGQAGMHVHVTRNGITEHGIRNLSVFLNAKDNLGLIELVSNRKLNRFCKQNPYMTYGSKPAYKAEDRYTILNTSRVNTIEFRSFKSTISFDRFLRNLEFVDASIEFCSMSDTANLTSAAFCNFVSNCKKRYTRLSKSIDRWYKYHKT